MCVIPANNIVDKYDKLTSFTLLYLGTYVSNF